MIDQFAHHRSVERMEVANLCAVLGTENWAVARRTKRIVERYGVDVVCVSSARLVAIAAQLHEREGCPAGCPARQARTGG